MVYPNLAFPYPHMPHYKRDTYSIRTPSNMYPRNHEPKILETSPKQISKKEKALFEFLGVKLYFDDVLLICLIFFLYQEGVKDKDLLITLILLLLS